MAGFFFRDTIEYSIEDLIQKNMGSSNCQNVLEKARETILGQNSISKEVLEPELRNYAEENGFSAGQVFGTLRVAVTGQRVSPPLFESMEIIGYEKVLERINSAIQICPG
jgi:glutamyl-tRNA synthetase